MKILHVIFSCNRLRYLTKTLDSLRNLDYGEHQVDRLIIDDYPRTRNDSIFNLICKINGFRFKGNPENYGLSLNWSKMYDDLRTSDYDYILHQEDDVLLLEPMKIDDLIQILESDSKMASVILRRQPWYYGEVPTTINPDDTLFLNKYYGERSQNIFSIIFSLYRKNIVDIPFKEYYNFNLNEGMIGVYLSMHLNMYSVVLKNIDGGNIIEHIGEESTGKRILPNEPKYEMYSYMDPNRFYKSRDGTLIE